MSTKNNKISIVTTQDFVYILQNNLLSKINRSTKEIENKITIKGGEKIGWLSTDQSYFLLLQNIEIEDLLGRKNSRLIQISTKELSFDENDYNLLNAENLFHVIGNNICGDRYVFDEKMKNIYDIFLQENIELQYRHLKECTQLYNYDQYLFAHNNYCIYKICPGDMSKSHILLDISVNSKHEKLKNVMIYQEYLIFYITTNLYVLLNLEKNLYFQIRKKDSHVFWEYFQKYDKFIFMSRYDFYIINISTMTAQKYKHFESLDMRYNKKLDVVDSKYVLIRNAGHNSNIVQFYDMNVILDKTYFLGIYPLVIHFFLLKKPNMKIFDINIIKILKLYIDNFQQLIPPFQK